MQNDVSENDVSFLYSETRVATLVKFSPRRTVMAQVVRFRCRSCGQPMRARQGKRRRCNACGVVNSAPARPATTAIYPHEGWLAVGHGDPMFETTLDRKRRLRAELSWSW